MLSAPHLRLKLAEVELRLLLILRKHQHVALPGKAEVLPRKDRNVHKRVRRLATSSSSSGVTSTSSRRPRNAPPPSPDLRSRIPRGTGGFRSIRLNAEPLRVVRRVSPSPAARSTMASGGGCCSGGRGRGGRGRELGVWVVLHVSHHRHQ